MFVQIEDWRNYIKEGEQYLQTALKAAEKRKEVFTPEILYNITAMAIEKFIMGYLMFHGDLAENHTMADLVYALERHAGSQPELKEKLLYLDSFQEICDMLAANYRSPKPEELPKVLTIGQEVKDFTMGKLSLVQA